MYLQITPKTQREGRQRQNRTQNWIGNSPDGPPVEISYIPREQQSIRPPNVTEDNVNPLDLTSYMHLPTTVQDNRTCGKCDDQEYLILNT